MVELGGVPAIPMRQLESANISAIPTTISTSSVPSSRQSAITASVSTRNEAFDANIGKKAMSTPYVWTRSTEMLVTVLAQEIADWGSWLGCQVEVSWVCYLDRQRALEGTDKASNETKKFLQFSLYVCQTNTSELCGTVSMLFYISFIGYFLLLTFMFVLKLLRYLSRDASPLNEFLLHGASTQHSVVSSSSVF